MPRVIPILMSYTESNEFYVDIAYLGVNARFRYAVDYSGTRGYAWYVE